MKKLVFMVILFAVFVQTAFASVFLESVGFGTLCGLVITVLTALIK